MSEEIGTGWTVKEKDAVLNEIMALRKDLNDLVSLLYGTKDIPAVTTNENTEELK